MQNESNNGGPDVNHVRVVPRILEVGGTRFEHLGPIVESRVKDTDAQEHGPNGDMLRNIISIIDIHDMNVYDHHNNVEHVHHTAEDMVLSRILVPFELDQLLDSFGGKDFKLFCFVDKTHQIIFTVDESFQRITVVINSILDILSDLWQNVDRVSDFIDLILVNILIITIFVVENRRNIREYRLVIVS